MPRLKTLLWATTVFSLCASTTLSAAGDVEQGKQAAQVCIACHGPEGAGQAAANYPRLDILDAAYISKQLHDLKSGSRESPIMQPFAVNLSEQQIKDMAAFYASQDATVPQPSSADADLLELGEKLATRGDWDRYIPACSSCHGPGNHGVGSQFPALAGQHASYIESQLRAWRKGTRGNDPQNLMLAVAERMSDTDIKAAAAYLAAQPAK